MPERRYSLLGSSDGLQSTSASGTKEVLNVVGHRLKGQIPILSTVALILLLAIPAGAGSLATTDFTTMINVPPMLEVEVDPEQILFSDSDILGGDIQNGEITVEKLGSIDVTTRGNIPHSLWISAGGDFETPGGGILPVSRLEWRLLDGPWTPFSLLTTLMLTQPNPGVYSSLLDLRLTVYITDPIGLYSGDLIFTVASSI